MWLPEEVPLPLGKLFALQGSQSWGGKSRQKPNPSGIIKEMYPGHWVASVLRDVSDPVIETPPKHMKITSNGEK